MIPFNFSFRLKILFGVVGVVVVLLGVLLLFVRGEMSRQIEAVTFQIQSRANRVFLDMEGVNSQELLRFNKRMSEKPRIKAALQEAVEEGEPGVLAEAANYEMNLAQIPLAVFTDERGEPVITLLNGEARDDILFGDEEFKSFNIRNLQVSRLLSKKVRNVSGYLVMGGRLYFSHGIFLSLFNQAVGTMTIGFPVSRELVERMGNVAGAHVAFFVRGKMLVSTPLEPVSGLGALMAETADSDEPRTVVLGDEHWLLVSDPLLPDAPRTVRRVLAVSLTPYLAPLRRIRTVFTVAGIIALFFAVVLGYSISRGLAAPVKRLVEATGRIARGDYNAQVRIKGRDELSVLGESFNRMIHDLKLKEQYRGILDKVVSPEVAEEMVKGKITLGGENREVTTLFADVRGFTSMTENMEPQEVIAMLNQYMEQAASAIESEGGVVDKYVGDEVMAIFGAPVQSNEDPLWAVRAALKIKENIEKLNDKRKEQGEKEIKIGIGINTGIAVAGNMGSVNRLNYTVLGESVNIAARLCSQAGPGEILVSEDTFKRVDNVAAAEPREIKPMKGISKTVKVFSVTGFKRKPGQVFRTLVLIAMMLCGIGSSLLNAEPLLQYVSPDGKFQVDFTGRAQVTGYLPRDAPAYLIYETDAFVAGRLSLFTDIFWGDRFYAMAEVRVDRGEIPANESLAIRLQQGFLRYTLLPSYNLHIQVGKFVSPFGAFSQRHDSPADPFIRPPLMHEYRTMICPGIAPRRNDGFIGWKDRPSLFRPTGAPVIWGVPYQFGVMVFGTSGDFSFRVAAMNSAPSSDPVQWDLDFRQQWNYSWVAHLSWAPAPELTLGVSFDYGPYSLSEIEDTLHYSDINDYNQVMWGFNASYTLGRLAVHAELIYDTWQVPNVIDDPVDISYYLEIMYKFFPGFYGAVRYNGIHFNRIALTDGSRDRWDYNVQRWQTGIGYRFSRRLETRAEYMFNTSSGPYEPKDDLFSLQWIYRF